MFKKGVVVLTNGEKTPQIDPFARVKATRAKELLLYRLSGWGHPPDGIRQIICND